MYRPLFFPHFKDLALNPKVHLASDDAFWISQLNTTYTALENIKGNCATTQQPGGGIYGDNSTATVNGTV